MPADRSINDILAEIRTAVYGRDVRQAIVDGINQCYEDGRAGVEDATARALAQEAKSAASAATTRIDEVDTKTNRIFTQKLAKVSITFSANNTANSFGYASGTATFQNWNEDYRLLGLLWYDTSDQKCLVRSFQPDTSSSGKSIKVHAAFYGAHSNSVTVTVTVRYLCAKKSLFA